MSRSLSKIVIPLLSLAVALGLFFHFASNKNRVTLEQSVTGTYRISAPNQAAASLLSVTEEDRVSIQNLLQCALKVSRDPRTPFQFEITVTVGDSRPAIAVHRKAVDLVTVVLREQAISLLRRQLLELDRYNGQTAKLDWLKSQERLIQSNLNFAENGFTLEKTSRLRSHSNALHTLAPMPFLVAAIFCFLLLLRRGIALKTEHLLKVSRSGSKSTNPIDDALGPCLSALETPATEGPRFAEVFESIDQELILTGKGNILILGEPVDSSKTDFTLRFAHHLTRAGRAVHLVDFDLKGRTLSSRLGRERSLGISDYLKLGGPSTEFSSSVAGLGAKFTPAGQTPVIEGSPPEARIAEYFKTPKNGILLTEACSTSPLHLIIGQVEGVLYVDPRRPSRVTYSAELQILLALREAQIPIWAVSTERHSFFPML